MPAPVYPISPVQPPPTVPGLTHNTQHVETAWSRLLSQFQDKERLKKLIEILLRPFQELEDALWDIYTNRNLDTDNDAQLDIFGRIAVEPRNGLTNADYRPILKAKLRALRSKGTGPDIIAITQLCLGSNGFTFEEIYPAAMYLTVTDVAVTDSQLQTLKRLLRVKAGGVGLRIVDARGGVGVRFHYGSEGTGAGYGVGSYGTLV